MTPSDRPTEPDHDVPESPTALDPASTDAPAWAQELMSLILTGRDEERKQLHRIEKNQKLQLKEIQRVSRRVADHDSEISDLRERVETIEKSIENIEERHAGEDQRQDESWAPCGRGTGNSGGPSASG